MSDAVKRVFDDLLNIEVNTMVKSGMTGRKMPVLGHALLDIHGGYERWLNAYATELDAQWSAFRESPDATEFVADALAAGDDGVWWVIDDGQLIDHVTITAPFDGEANGVKLFEEMRERARVAEEMHRLLAGRRGFTVRDGGDVMLQRIIRNCDQLKTILRLAAPGDTAVLTRATPRGIEHANTDDLPRDALITVRKAWEMGTEVVALQTVVQVDGDIVTRLNSAYVAERHQPVRDLHRESVGSAVEHWHYLVDTVVSIAKSAAGIFT